MVKLKKELCECRNYRPTGADSGIMYFLGFIGASIYYLQTATGFWNGALGILKALAWPAFLVYKILMM